MPVALYAKPSQCRLSLRSITKPFLTIDDDEDNKADSD